MQHRFHGRVKQSRVHDFGVLHTLPLDCRLWLSEDMAASDSCWNAAPSTLGRRGCSADSTSADTISRGQRPEMSR